MLELSRRRFVGMTAGLLSLPRIAGIAADDPLTSEMLVHGKVPMNAEPRLPELVKSWMTPTESFYIRSHAPVPEISAQDFRLKIEGHVEQPLSISLAELAHWKQHTVTCTMTCAGNRRTEHSQIKPVKGVPWEAGAIGNAKWSGVRLSDVLKKAGLKESARHVWFEGLDQIQRDSAVIPFGASIPIEKALLDTTKMPGALLTTAMNGKPLNGDHGAPLRMVVPGYIGARSVKWLGRIVISDRPSPNHYVANAYKLVTDGDPLEVSEQGPIYRFPLNSVICTINGADHYAEIAGYALPSGRPECTVSKIEVSADGGRSWSLSKAVSPVQEYCWVLWTARVNLQAKSKHILVRAFDSKGTSQPRKAKWNKKGYLFNGWHQVDI